MGNAVQEALRRAQERKTKAAAKPTSSSSAKTTSAVQRALQLAKQRQQKKPEEVPVKTPAGVQYVQQKPKVGIGSVLKEVPGAFKKVAGKIFGFGKTVAQETAKPFVKAGVTAQRGVESTGALLSYAIAKKLGRDDVAQRIIAEENQKARAPVNVPGVGVVSPVTTPRESIGTGLQIGATVFGPKGAGAISKATKVGVGGASVGGSFALGSGLSDKEKNAKQVALETGVGVVAGGVLEKAGSLITKNLRKVIGRKATTPTPTPKVVPKVEGSSAALATGKTDKILKELKVSSDPYGSMPKTAYEEAGIKAVVNGKFNPKVAAGRIADVQQKLNQVKPGLGDKLKVNADDLTPEQLYAQAEKLVVGTKTKTAGFAQTIGASKKASPELKAGMAGQKYEVISNKSAEAAATTRITKSIDEAETFVLNAKKPTAEHTVTAMKLIDTFESQGNHERAVRTAQKIAQELTRSGQAIQAAKVYNRLTPEGVVVYAQKNIDAFNAGRLFPKFRKSVKLTPELTTNLRTLAQQIRDTSDKTLKGELQDELAGALAKLSPSTIGQKLSSAQTVAQLLNPKTIAVRNPLGNELFYRLERFNKTFVTTPIDVVRSTLTGGKRTVTFHKVNQGGYWKGFIQGAKAGWKGQPINALETQFDLKGPAFRSKWNPMLYLEKSLGATLRGFDNAAYTRAKNQTIGELAWLQAYNQGLRGSALKKAAQTSVDKLDDNLLNVADEYGKYITFQDNNLISIGLQKLKKGLNLGKSFGAGDIVLKYPKTPGALIARGLEYSPAGFLRSAYLLAKPVFGSTKLDTRAVTEGLSRAITGTLGLTGMGYFLADKGIITGSPGKDTDVNAIVRGTGGGQYKVNLSALTRWVKSGFDSTQAETKQGDKMYSYDWAQPIAISLSIGANANKQVKAGKSVTSGGLGTALESLEGGLQTIAEQPLFTGVRRFLLRASGDKPTSILKDFVKDLPASFVPTFFNQLRQLADNTARETYDPNLFQEALNKVKARIPGVAANLRPRIDVAGQPQQTFQGGSNNLFNVLLNPGFSSKYNPDAVATEVIGLYTKTGKGTQAPTLVSKEQTVNGKDIQLTGVELERMQKYVGQVTYKEFGKLMESSKYQQMSDDERVKELGNIITDVRDAARIKILGNNPKTRSKDVKAILKNYLAPSATEYDKEADSPQNAVETVKAYIKGFAEDPGNTWKALWTDERLRKVINDTTVLERKKFLAELDNGDKNSVIDHIVPLSLGGDNSISNLRVVPTKDNQQKAAVETYLLRQLKNKKIGKDDAQRLILHWVSDHNFDYKQAVEALAPGATKEEQAFIHKLLGVKEASAAVIEDTPKELRVPITKSARKYNVPDSLLSSILKVESGWNPKNYTRQLSGGTGIAQFTGIAIQELNRLGYPFTRNDAKDPQKSIAAAAFYLGVLKKRKGSWKEAVRAYNGNNALLKSGVKVKDAYVQKVFANIPTLSLQKKATLKSSAQAYKGTSELMKAQQFFKILSSPPK